MTSDATIQYQLEVEAYLQERCIEVLGTKCYDAALKSNLAIISYIQISIYDWCYFYIIVHEGSDIFNSQWCLYLPCTKHINKNLKLYGTLDELIDICKKHIINEN